MAKSPSGKVYIGQHHSNELNKRKKTHYIKFLQFSKCKLYLALEKQFQPNKFIPLRIDGCCTALYTACLKYGFGSFTWSVIHKNILKQNLNTLEDDEIKQNTSLAPNGYNLKINGKIEGHSYSKKTRELQSDIQKKLMKTAYVKYRKHHDKLQGLPQHTSYAYNKTMGHVFIVVGHPKCAKKTFSSISMSFEKLKKIFVLFMRRLEIEDVHPDIIAVECYTEAGVAKGIYPSNRNCDNFIVRFSYRRKRYYKEFDDCGNATLNLRTAATWLVNKKLELHKQNEEGSETK